MNDVKSNKTRKMLNPEELIDDDGIPLYFTKENATLIGGSFEERKIEVFEKLHKTYTKNQVGYVKIYESLSMFCKQRQSDKKCSFYRIEALPYPLRYPSKIVAKHPIKACLYTSFD
jgi:hypothetical protein